MREALRVVRGELTGALPEGVSVGSGGDSRTVTVETGRRLPVNFGLTDGSSRSMRATGAVAA